MSINEKDLKLVLNFKENISQDLRNQIKKIIIFGSRATGDAQDDSDLDIVVLASQKTPQLEIKLEDIAYKIMWDNDFKPIISLKIFEESSFNDAFRRGYSFYKNVNDYGVSV